ncbi:MAG: hypothetical protein ACOCW6_04575 [Spirochaetota bacterium]
MNRTPGRPPGRRRAPPAVVLLFLSVLTLLVSCGNDYLLVVDPVFETLVAPGKVGKESIRKQIEETTNRSVGWAPSVSFDGNLGNQIDSILSSETPTKGVILAPLLFNEAPALASGYPELQFLLLSEAPDEASNLMSIRFDRVEAFRDAGNAAADHLLEAGTSLVLFSHAGGETARRELDAFEEALPPDSVDRRFVYSRAPERETIRGQILSVGEGAYLWAFFLRGNTPFALDLIASRGDPAVAEDLGPGTGYGAFVIGSVERDYVDAIGRGVEALEDRSPGAAPGKSVVVVPATFVSRSGGFPAYK